MRNHDTRVVSSSPTRVTIKTPLVRKVTGNHLIKPTSLEKDQRPVSGFCYARSGVCKVAVDDLLPEQGKLLPMLPFRQET